MFCAVAELIGRESPSAPKTILLLFTRNLCLIGVIDI